MRDETGTFVNRLALKSVWLGGFYALIYYAPFALAYEIARFTRRILMKRRNQRIVIEQSSKINVA